MSAERDLSKLLSALEVQRHDSVWTFSTGPNHPGEGSAMAFLEREGWTAVRKAAETTEPSNRWAWLELSVNSDLNAVGFLARVATALADAGVPCNAVAAYHHDHIFVPEDKADTAILALQDLRAAAASPK